MYLSTCKIFRILRAFELHSVTRGARSKTSQANGRRNLPLPLAQFLPAIYHDSDSYLHSHHPFSPITWQKVWERAKVWQNEARCRLWTSARALPFSTVSTRPNMS